MRNEVERLSTKLKEIQQLRKLEEHIDQIKNQMAWALVVEKEQVFVLNVFSFFFFFLTSFNKKRNLHITKAMLRNYKRNLHQSMLK